MKRTSVESFPPFFDTIQNDTSMTEIKLTQGYVALVDDDDYDWLSINKWQVCKVGCYFYARRNEGSHEKQKVFLMHRVIMGAVMPMYVDHIDGNGLNNQRSNLRICTKLENHQHHIRVRGVIPYMGVTKKRWRFMARITVNGKTIRLGVYSTQEQAAFAYDVAAVKYFKEFAYLNFPYNYTSGLYQKLI